MYLTVICPHCSQDQNYYKRLEDFRCFRCKHSLTLEELKKNKATIKTVEERITEGELKIVDGKITKT